MSRKIEKNDRLCYTKNGYDGRVMSGMISSAESIGNLISRDENIEVELDKNKRNCLIEKIELLLFVKQIKLIYKKNKQISNSFERRKDVLNGKIVIKNTRITPDTIVNYVIQKSNEVKDCDKLMEQILLDYPSITDDDVIAALIYEIANMSYIKIIFSKL